MLKDLRSDLKRLADPKKAKILQRFFKTGPGDYGAGDVFWGITSAKSRPLVCQYKDLSLTEIKQLLRSKIHEERQMALRILMYQYEHGSLPEQERIYRLYLKSTPYINNWDLVDLSAPKIVGAYLFCKPRAILYKLVRSNNLWERRIAVLATFYFIRYGQYADTLKLAELLLKDKHDLMHKAVGWMLREVGKRSLKTEVVFLDKYACQMPRTMLRYAIEKLPTRQRHYYLSLK
ncbi:MAG: DNA alkylation repair protein [Candidatus Kerfeldbacteria bacterium]|nr:DNA alkylation repair protein [Candidatus Kerfeldbacteria bacterium]